MIVTLARDADPDLLRRALAGLGLWTSAFVGQRGETQLLVRAHSGAIERERLLALEGVVDVSEAHSSHPLVDAHPPRLVVAGRAIGAGAEPVLMAGPCSVESEDAIHEAAFRLAGLGVAFLRGGAFKPRTSPYEFQGVGVEGLAWLRSAADAHGLAVVTEALSEASVDAVAEHADLIQVGSRSMHSSALLRRIGQTGRPVLLKRGLAATVEEWLSAGEYCLAAGAAGVVFCERGIRGFDDATRNVLDLSSVALLAHVHGLPVIVDPSHALGRRDLIPHLSRASIAAGACGLIVEVHDAPERALSDAPQAISSRMLAELRQSLGSQGTLESPR